MPPRLTSLPLWCLTLNTAGVIRGFQKTILIVRDPFVTLWHEYIRAGNISVTALLQGNITIDKADWNQAIPKLVEKYSREKLNDQVAYRSLMEIFPPENALIVSYESLVYSQQKLDVLRDLLAFGHHDKITYQRLMCANVFIDVKRLGRELGKLFASSFHCLTQSNRAIRGRARF
jgi:hypothetical protein